MKGIESDTVIVFKYDLKNKILLLAETEKPISLLEFSQQQSKWS